MFPAFTSVVSEHVKNEPDQTWLSNETFHESLPNEEITTHDYESNSSDLSTSHSYTKKKRKLNKEKSQKHKSEKHHSEKRRHKELVDLLDKKIFLEDFSDLCQEEAFTQDKRRDKSIYKNGTISSKYVSKYYPSNCSILGMQSVMFLNKIPKKDRLKHHLKSRYFYKKNSKIVKAKPLYHYTDERLLSSSVVNAASMTVELPANYPLDLSESELSASKSELLNQIAQYNREVNANPRNIDTWLKLIDIQSEFITETANIKSKDKLKQLILEKQYSIVKNALQKNPGNVTLILKQLAIGEELSHEDVIHLWNQLTFAHPEKVNIWTKYLQFMCRNSSHYTTLKVAQAFAKCFTTLTKIISGKVLSHRAQPDTASKIIDLFSVYCKWLRDSGLQERALASWQALIEFTCYCPDNRRLVQGVDLAEDPLILDFEKYWNSETARFGEPDSVGWKTWLLRGTQYKERAHFIQSIDKRYCEVETSILKAGSTKSSDKLWGAIELLREKFHWLPWSKCAEDSNDVDDPDRMVLFDEISHCLIDFSGVVESGEYYDQLRCKIIVMFLDFLGLRHRIVCRDFLTSKEVNWLVDMEFILCKSSASYQQLQISPPENRSYTILLQNVLSQCQALFTESKKWLLAHNWSSYISCLQLKRVDMDTSSSMKAMMKEGKSILQRDCNRNDLTVWSAYAQILHQRGDSLTETRKILDTALTLFPLEEIENWPTIHQADLETWKVLLEKFILIDTFIDVELSAADSELSASRVYSLLLYSASGGVYSSTIFSSSVTAPQALKMKHSLVKRLQDYWSSLTKYCRDGSLPVPITSTLLTVVLRVMVHFSLISSSLNFISDGEKVLSEELASFLTRLSKLESNSLIKNYVISGELFECKNDFTTRLCRLYANHCRISQQDELLPLRSILMKHFSADQLANNPLILQYLFPAIRDNKERTPISTVIFFRNSITDLIQSEEAYSVWYLLFELEERRSSNHLNDYSGNRVAVNNRLRSLYEEVLDSNMFNQANLSVRLIFLRKFLTFESNLYAQCSTQHDASSSNKQKENLKSIFYRSIQRCPWAKNLYLAYVESVPECFSEIMDILIEREIRVRIPLEEVELLQSNLSHDDVQIDD